MCGQIGNVNVIFVKIAKILFIYKQLKSGKINKFY